MLLNRALDRLEEFVVTSLMAVATCVIFVSVLHRFLAGVDYPPMQDLLLKINLGWAQELCIILFVWMAKFGAAYGVRTGIHVGVDVIVNRLDSRRRNICILIGLLGGVLFTAAIGCLGAQFVWDNGAHYSVMSALGIDTGDYFEGPRTPDLEWPTWCVYSAIPLGSFLMCYRFVQVAISFARTGELPHHDHGHVDGLSEGHPAVDLDVFAMDDNLHPRDLKHEIKKGGHSSSADNGGKQ